MLNQGLELKVNRNETFTIDYTFIFPDGTPYIISSEFNNPWIVLSVTNTLFEQDGRYVKRWWLPLIQPTFFKTTTTKVEALTEDVKFIIVNIDGIPTSVNHVVDVIINNERKFMYWDVVTSQWLEYFPLRVVKTFTKADVIEWKENNYLYSVTLVDGIDMFNGLKDLILSLGYENDYTLEEMIEILQNEHPETIKDIELDVPLFEITTTYPIVEPTNLSVSSDISRRF